MKAFYFKLLIISVFLTVPLRVQAQIDYQDATDSEESAITVFGTACEPLKDGEARSSARIRASDKASFSAVENIAELVAYRQAFSAHDFNVLVYYLIDNYLEDLAVKTTFQDYQKLCVEVSGYLSNESILKAFNESFDKFGSAVSNQLEDKIVKLDDDNFDNQESLVLTPEKNAIIPPVNGLPPKPQPTFKPEMIEDIATVTNETDFEDETSALQEKPVNIVINNDKNFKVVKNSVEVEPNNTHDEENDKSIYVYIPDTEFFNNTTSSDYYDLLKSIAQSRFDVKITADAESADYILKSKILKAKVDPINSKTNRLHLIVSLELLDLAVNDTIKEHQNRFILFESNENEQTVAADLMEKMLKKAGDNIVKNIVYHRKGKPRQKDSSAIITPSSSRYGTNRAN